MAAIELVDNPQLQRQAHFLSPKIPANVVLRSFMVSSPSIISSSSSSLPESATLKGLIFPFPFLVILGEAFELSEAVVDSESDESESRNVD